MGMGLERYVKSLDLRKRVDRQKGGLEKRLPRRKQRTKTAASQEVKIFRAASV